MHDGHSELTKPRRRHWSIGTRLQAAAWLSGTVLAVTLALVVAWVGFPSLVLAKIGAGVQQASLPAVRTLGALQVERQQALVYLATPGADPAPLQRQEGVTSQGLQEMQTAAATALAGAPQQITDRYTEFAGLVKQLPQQRQMIESRAGNSQQAYAFYNTMLDSATKLFDAQARVVPDAPITQSAIAAVDLFRVADNMSRAGSLVTTAITNQSFDSAAYQQFQRLVGAYHVDLDVNAAYLEPQVQKSYGDVIRGPDFQQLSTAENALIARGPDPHRPDVPFPVNAGDWSVLTSKVSGQLIDLTIQQAIPIAAKAANDGSRQFWTTAAELAALFIVELFAAVFCGWQARSVSRRLGRLAQGVQTVATVEVPALAEEIQAGEDVDIPARVSLLDDRPDEIGGVAERFRGAVIADLQARGREIQAREGMKGVLTEFAHRIQIPVTRLLSILYEAQAREQNSEALALYYRVDNEAVRVRRIADNMIVLTGDQPRRRRDRPVPLFHILRAAATETTTTETIDQARHLQRFAWEKIPEVEVLPRPAYQVAHLLSELMDNAVRFSPPTTQIRVSGEETAHGVAIEIADAGRGLAKDDLDAANGLMQNPPPFDVMVGENAIRRLGWFAVAHMARALGIIVAFRRSAYQGVSAVVTLPEELLASAVPDHQGEPIGNEGQQATATGSSWFRTNNTVGTDDDNEDGTHVTQQPSFATPVSTMAIEDSFVTDGVGPRHARTAAPNGELVRELPTEGLAPLPRRRRRVPGSVPPATRASDLRPPDLDAGTQLRQLQRGTERGRRTSVAAEPGSDGGPAWPLDDPESRHP